MRIRLACGRDPEVWQMRDNGGFPELEWVVVALPQWSNVVKVADQDRMVIIRSDELYYVNGFFP